MKLLRNKQQESYENAKLCYICKKKKKKKNELKINIWKIKKYHKVRDLEITATLQGNTEVLHIAYVI